MLRQEAILLRQEHRQEVVQVTVGVVVGVAAGVIVAEVLHVVRAAQQEAVVVQVEVLQVEDN